MGDDLKDAIAVGDAACYIPLPDYQLAHTSKCHTDVVCNCLPGHRQVTLSPSCLYDVGAKAGCFVL